jgi:putative ABC transport system permease protein
LRTALTLGAVVCGVVGLILSGGFVEDIFVQLREATIHSQLGHVQVSRTGFSSTGRRDPFGYLMEEPDAVAGPLAALPGVEVVLMRLSFTGLLSNGRADTPIFGDGVEPDKEGILGTFVTIAAGRQLSDEDRAGILLGLGVARALQVGPGDPVTLVTTTADGAVNSLDFDVVGVFQSFSRDYDDRAVRVALPAAQELLDTRGIHTLVVSLQDTEMTDATVTRTLDLLGHGPFEVQPWYLLADFYQKTVDLYRRQFAVLQLITLGLVFLSVGTSLNMAIYERTGEIGTMLALGQSRGRVYGALMIESLLLGVIGSLLGLGLGILIAEAISHIGIAMPPMPNSEVGYTATIRLLPERIAVAAIAGVSASVLAAILPARRAVRLPITDALRANI